MRRALPRPRTPDQAAALIAWGAVLTALAGLGVVLGVSVAPWAGWTLVLVVALAAAVWFTRRALDAAELERAAGVHLPDPPRRPDGPPVPERLDLGPAR